MVLVVQDNSGRGKKLEVIVANDRNIVIENGSFSIEVGGAELIITPKLVEKMICDSIKLGWNPRELGPPVQLSLNKNKLEIRRGL